MEFLLWNIDIVTAQLYDKIYIFLGLQSSTLKFKVKTSCNVCVYLPPQIGLWSLCVNVVTADLLMESIAITVEIMSLFHAPCEVYSIQLYVVKFVGD